MTHFNISFAGAGRVAGAISREMFRSGITIDQIVSESASEGKPLADECKAKWSSELSFSDRNQVVIVAVPDHKLIDVLAAIKCNGKCIVAHTAGSFGLEIFPARLEKRGVFYPLQTFSKGRLVDFKNLPFLIEASDKESIEILDYLAVAIGGKVHHADAEKRRMVHLAAVFFNNFTNYMLTAGRNVADHAGLPPEIFEPLIRETICKALEKGPEGSQTGPAVRNDLNTIEMHMKLLSFSPELQHLYGEVTDSIIRYYQKKRG